MPLLVAEAAKLSQDDLQRGVIEEIIEKDQLFALLPFVHSADKNYAYNRESTISEATFLDPYDAVPEGAATYTEVTAPIKALVGDVDMDKFLTTVQSGLNDQIALQLASKAKGIARKFRRTVAIGDNGTNSKEFDGIVNLVTGAQTLSAATNGAAVSFSALDELKDMVKNGSDVLMMRQGTWRAVRALLRAMGGNMADTIMIEGFGHPIPVYDGVPVIINDYLPGDEVQGTETAACSIYAMRMNEADGLHGIYGGPNAGAVVENIGTVQNKDASRWRVKWYAGLALKATHSLARLQGITNI